MLIALFVTPLLVFSDLFIFPFVVSKVFVLRSLIIALAAVYLILVLNNWQQYKVSPHPLHYAVILFLLSYSISTFVGVDWYRSFWENHERMLGLFTLVHYILLYAIASSSLRSWQDWRTVFRGISIFGGIVMVIALLQQINPELLLNRGNRSASTLGNPIYVGGYALFLLAVAYLLMIKETVRSWKRFAQIAALLALGGLLASGTRGSLLGLFSAIVVSLVGYVITMKQSAVVRKWVSIGAASFIVLISVLFFFRNTGFVQSIPTVGRVFSLSFSATTLNTRLMAWDVAWQGTQEHLLFGWGPSNFFYLFNKYYQPEFLYYGYTETWFDNAHNVVVNTLATQGIVGVVAYLGLFLTLAYCLIRAYRHRMIDAHVMIIGLAFFAAHFVHNLFVFENVTSYLYFFLFLAFFASQTTIAVDKKNTALVRKPVSSVIIWAICLLALVFIWITNINPARANARSLVALRQLNAQSEGVLDYYEQEVKSIPTPHRDDVVMDVSRIFIANIDDLVKQNRLEDIEAGALLMEKDMADIQALHPLDVRLYIQRAELYRIMGNYAPSVSFFYTEAEKLLLTAKELSPKRQQLNYLLAAIYAMQERHDDAIVLLEEALAADTRVGESWWRLAVTHQDKGDIEKATALIEEAFAKQVLFDTRGLDVIQNVLQMTLPQYLIETI